MSQEAFIRGFFKAAADFPIDPQSIVQPMQELSGSANFGASNLYKLLALAKNTTSALGGAGVGAGVGYLSGGEDERKAKRRAIMGALLGGGTGLALNNLQ